MADLPMIALGAWAWAIAKGTLPIIGVTKENQVLDAVKAVNITLSDEEVLHRKKRIGKWQEKYWWLYSQQAV